MQPTTTLKLLLLVFAAFAMAPAAWAFNCCRAADITDDGRVDQADIDELLERFGLPDPRADLDASGVVDQGDIDLVERYLGIDCSTWCPADFNVDGDVDSEDRAILMEHFGEDCQDQDACFDLNASGTVLWGDLWFLLASTGECGSLPEPIPFPKRLRGDPPNPCAIDPDDPNG